MLLHNFGSLFVFLASFHLTFGDIFIPPKPNNEKDVSRGGSHA